MNKMAEKKVPHNMLGLDPLFRVFVKLYIVDILQLRTDEQLKGVYYYKEHPVQRVDIMGVVVKVQQKPKFVKYYVDDGTGVIPVTCWQVDTSHNQHHKLQDIPACLVVLLETQPGDSEVLYHLGDLIHVQGKVREFHDQREISAVYHKVLLCFVFAGKCTDPMEEVVRMSELPDLYTKLYDTPFQPPAKVADECLQVANAGLCDRGSFLMDLESLILSSLSDECSLEGLLNVEIVSDFLLKAEIDRESHREYVEKTLNQLELKGLIFPTHQQFYRAVSLCKGLESKILNILKLECQNTKYADRGCPISRVYDTLRRHLDFSKVTRAAVTRCLETMEGRSDVISTSTSHYIAFGT